MTWMKHGSASDLIDRSISHTEIVFAEWTVQRAADLLDDSDGSCDCGEVVEFWGSVNREDTGPQEWRVHLRQEKS